VVVAAAKTSQSAPGLRTQRALSPRVPASRRGALLMIQGDSRADMLAKHTLNVQPESLFPLCPAFLPSLLLSQRQDIQRQDRHLQSAAHATHLEQDVGLAVLVFNPALHLQVGNQPRWPW